MATFLVTGCGHSGTHLLAAQLGEAHGWAVRHEPDAAVASWLVTERFEDAVRQGKDYGEVNSFLLTSARDVPADRKAVLLRNPYDVACSIARPGHEQCALTYVVEGISTLDSLVRSGFDVILFRGIVRSRRYVVRKAASLGVSLDHRSVRTRVRLGGRDHPAAPMTFDALTRRTFDRFVYAYDLEESSYLRRARRGTNSESEERKEDA